MKTSELIDEKLDWAVAKCEVTARGVHPGYLETETFALNHTGGDFCYSTNWAQGGPIIEREGISIKENLPSMPDNRWNAFPSRSAKGAGGKWGAGPTPLIAAMRCYVASKLGDEVEIPEELL